MEDADFVVFVDSSVLISCGRRGGARFRALSREARQRDAAFRITPAVYAEVAGDPMLDDYTVDDSAVERALQKGWLKVTESPSYSDPDVSSVMDRAQRFIASAGDRTEDVVERADTEIVGLALEMLQNDTARRVSVLTNDVPLGNAAETLIPQYGFDDDQIVWWTGSEFAPELDADYVSEFE